MCITHEQKMNLSLGSQKVKRINKNKKISKKNHNIKHAEVFYQCKELRERLKKSQRLELVLL